MTKIYTLVNQKGGVGKTTSTINMAAYLARLGQHVLVVDLDPQANATSCLGVDKLSVQGGTYEALLGEPNIFPYVLLNERLQLSLLPSPLPPPLVFGKNCFSSSTFSVKPGALVPALYLL